MLHECCASFPGRAGVLNLESHDHKFIVRDEVPRSMIGNMIDDTPTMGESGILANVLIQVRALHEMAHCSRRVSQYFILPGDAGREGELLAPWGTRRR